ncbi:MAG: glycosyltransferase family 39 protein [Rhodocyclaceae bacterium]
MNLHPRLVLALLLVGTALLFLGAPHDGAFYWSDAPRHALNGVFVKDLVLAMPWRDPSGFAYAYYAQYPALTILFYPPLFYVLSAPFYALFGVSHETALLVVCLHYMAFAWGCWKLFRFWLPATQAGLAAALLVCAPEITFWGRQIMLEVPSLAFLIWSAVCFMHYRREGRTLHLTLAIFLLVAAMYTKITAAFLAPVYLLCLLHDRGWRTLRDYKLWLIAIAAVLALVPLVVLTLKFGQANVQSVSGIADAEVSRRSLAGWLWYFKQLPDQLGWPVLIAACGGLLAMRWLPRDDVQRGDALFWLAWFGIGYLFFSAIDLKEARHSVFILPPVVAFAVFLLTRLPRQTLAIAALAALGIAVIVQTVFFRPVLKVEGYAQVADWIAHHAPRDSAVLFSGYRDGSFVFNMREREDRRDLTVVRADKILLRVAVRRALGVEEKPLSEADISDQLNKLGVKYLVVQPGFWNDLAAMQRFERVIASPQFKQVARFDTPANYPAHEKELVIYENLGPVATGPREQSIDLPIINHTIKSQR